MYQDYIKTELLVLVPVLYIIGLGLKKSKLADKWIPFVLGVISVLLAAVWVFSTTTIHGVQQIGSALFTTLTQGVLLAGASVYANQLYVQGKKDE